MKKLITLMFILSAIMTGVASAEPDSSTVVDCYYEANAGHPACK